MPPHPERIDSNSLINSYRKQFFATNSESNVPRGPVRLFESRRIGLKQLRIARTRRRVSKKRPDARGGEALYATFGSGLTVRTSSVPHCLQPWVTSARSVTPVLDTAGSINVTTIRWPQ
jgi:hypothetical protein